MKEFEVSELKYEDAMATRYNEDYHSSPVTQYQDEIFTDYVASFIRQGDRVLDLGCGPGSLWSYWDKKINSKCNRLVGIDLSPGMIQEAKRLFPKGEFKVGRAFEIPEASGTFDVVIISSMLHHIPDENLSDVLVEVSRVLDEHGSVVGREPLETNRIADRGDWLSGVIMSFRHYFYRKFHVRSYPEPDIGPHHHAYDARKFVDLMSKNLFVEDVQFKFPFSSYLANIKNNKALKIFQYLDSWLPVGGQQLFYKATKNYFDGRCIKENIQKSLDNNEVGEYNKKEFLALIQAATKLLDKELKKVSNTGDN